MVSPNIWQFHFWSPTPGASPVSVQHCFLCMKHFFMWMYFFLHCSFHTELSLSRSAFPSCTLMTLKCSFCKRLYMCCACQAILLSLKGLLCTKIRSWKHLKDSGLTLHTDETIPKNNTAAIIAASDCHWWSQHQDVGLGFEGHGEERQREICQGLL